ncbi:MAG: GNAT family N-acetyltransferase [bacterium]|nr:GNAT family N-acetyltransferase [bacterium]
MSRSPSPIIREACLEDASILCKWWNDPEIMTHVGLPNGLEISVDQVQDLILASEEAAPPPPRSKRFMILAALGREPIGELNYSNWDPERQVVSVGIKICKLSARRKGYGRAALESFLVLLQDVLQVRTVTLEVLARNTPAWNLYERLGFHRVRRRKGAYMCKATSERLDVFDYHISLDRTIP